MKSKLCALAFLICGTANAQFSCVPLNPIGDVTYLNVVGARAWGWVCPNGDINTIIQLKTFYTSAVCGRAVESTIRQYRDRESSENLSRINITLRDCQKIPAAGTDELYLYNTTRLAIKDKTRKEHAAKLKGVR